MTTFTMAQVLPQDSDQALLVGRIWAPRPIDGPVVVLLRGDAAYDLTSIAPTMSQLLEIPDLASVLDSRLSDLSKLAALEEIVVGPLQETGAGRPRLLAPCDLQVVKAAGVTFAFSLLERVVEEQAKGDYQRAEELRSAVQETIGTDLSAIVPGSEEAMALKERLVALNAWSQYLEVGIGPDAEVFTKCPAMSSVGCGSDIGIHPRSEWSNPEPEIVLAVNSRGEIVGATLGNDVNLRDFEGRSALLLARAKDNNASCSIGPVIRVFDGSFSLDDVRAAEVDLEVKGPEGYTLHGRSNMAQISRDPADIVGQTISANHQYPDGFVLFLGTMFAPIEDRDTPGMGFTHKIGDQVTVSCPSLGRLINRVDHSDKLPPWQFGIGALMANLRARGAL